MTAARQLHATTRPHRGSRGTEAGADDARSGCLGHGSWQRPRPPQSRLPWPSECARRALKVMASYSSCRRACKRRRTLPHRHCTRQAEEHALEAMQVHRAVGLCSSAADVCHLTQPGRALRRGQAGSDQPTPSPAGFPSLRFHGAGVVEQRRSARFLLVPTAVPARAVSYAGSPTQK